MGELKAGDLCLIVGCMKNPVNIGKVCQLVEPLWPGDHFNSPGGKVLRRYIGEDGLAWLVVGDDLWVGPDNYEGFSLVDPKHLMPLRGGEIGQEGTAQQGLAA